MIRADTKEQQELAAERAHPVRVAGYDLPWEFCGPPAPVGVPRSGCRAAVKWAARKARRACPLVVAPVLGAAVPGVEPAGIIGVAVTPPDITWAAVEKRVAAGWRELYGSPTATLPPPPPSPKREKLDRGYSVPGRFFAPELRNRNLAGTVPASVGRESVSFVPVFDGTGDTELSAQPEVRYCASGKSAANVGRAFCPEIPETAAETQLRKVFGLAEANPERAAGMVCRKAFPTIAEAKTAAARLYAAGVGAVVRVGHVVVVTATVPLATARTVVGGSVRRQLLAAGFEVVEVTETTKGTAK